MSTWNINIPEFVDGESTLSASTINPVISALADRDQWLFDAVNTAAAETMLVATNQAIQGNLSYGVPVYFETASGTPVLTPAISGYTSSTTDGHLFPAESSYVFGIIKTIYSGSGEDGIYYGDVYIRGLINDSNINFTTLLDTESAADITTLEPQALFLSSKEAGKLSIYPTGASAFVGYFLGNNSIVLAPNIDSLSQLYFNYQVYLNPAPAGTAVNTSGTLWSVNSPSYSTLGWIDASDAATTLSITPPSGAQFYYNIPTDAQLATALASDTITAEQARQATLLKKALPANPASYSLLFTNGVLQTQKDADHTGSYTIDSNGIWWNNNNTNYLPWTNGTVTGIAITNGGSGYGSAPTITITGGTGSGATATCTISGGVVNTITITNPGNGYTTIPTITFSSGSAAATASITLSSPEPTIQLFITKINPNYASSIVTSLTSTNPAIQFTDQFGANATTGDLDVTLNLDIVNNNTSTGNGNAIQSMSYDLESGVVSTISAPVVNTITTGPGLEYSITSGQAVLALSNFSLSGEVQDIEPEEADFVYKGLNAYLRLKRPAANQRIGFIGKLKLPASIPVNTNLSFSLLAFTETGSSSGANSSWVFEYATSNTGSSISTAVTSNSFYIPGTSFPSLVQATVSMDSTSSPCFVVPYSSFSANSFINFRIARTYDSSATYANPIGVLGVTWAIA